MALFRFHSGGAAARKLDLPDDLDELDLEELEELDDLGGSSASKDAAESGPGPSCSEGDNETPLTLGNPVDKPVEILPAPPTVSSKAKTKPAARARSVAK